MKRVFHPWWLWEDYKAGFYENVSGEKKKMYLKSAVEMFNDEKKTKENAIKLLQDQRVSVQWHEEEEKWFFSIEDIIGILTESPNTRKFWSVLKGSLKKEGSELSQFLGQLKMQSSDGKNYKTDVANTQQLLRLIQSIP